MKYSFKDIDNEDFYEDARVVIVTGQYNIFNNRVVDKLKEISKPTDTIEKDVSLLAEFGVDIDEDEESTPNTVDFDTFMEVKDMASLNGKWFCRADIKMMKKNQIERFNEYLKNPSEYGILVVVANEYMDFRGYLKNKFVIDGRYSHIIQLGFPNKSKLSMIVRDLFMARGVSISARSADLFVMRLSSAYDDYDATVDRICVDYGKNKDEITYDEMKMGLKGIDNFILDDFMDRILNPMPTDKISINRTIYKMEASLLGEMDVEVLVNKIKRKVEEYIEFRLAINKGLIPVRVRFSVPEAKERIGKNSRLYNIPDFRFRDMANIASRTSLRDWLFMKMILSNTKRGDKLTYEKALYTLIHRSVLSKERIENDLGTVNILENDIKYIDSIKYKED